MRNVHHMMAYAFRAVEADGYSSIAGEEFEHFEDLMAAILAHAVGEQRRRGLERDYVRVTEDVRGVRGRVEPLPTAINIARGRVASRCTFDEYSQDTLMNRVIRTALEALLAGGGVSEEYAIGLRASLALLGDVRSLAPSAIDWGRLSFHRNNASYELVMSVCRLVLESSIISEGEGGLRRYRSTRTLHDLYEKFLLNYYRVHFPRLRPESRRFCRCRDASAPAILPGMRTDVVLESPSTTLVIDAKFYGRILVTDHGKEMLSPAHVNQIENYVAHLAYDGAGSGRRYVGMLLYAKTAGEEPRHDAWTSLGNEMWCRTLDLNRDFSNIASTLDGIAAMLG